MHHMIQARAGEIAQELCGLLFHIRQDASQAIVKGFFGSGNAFDLPLGMSVGLAVQQLLPQFEPLPAIGFQRNETIQRRGLRARGEHVSMTSERAEASLPEIFYLPDG